MNRHTQIDFAKGLAALAVVLLHSVTREVLTGSLAVLHIWQAVPVFIVLMGATTRLASIRSQAGTGSRLGRRVVRLLGPFVPVWLLSLALALAMDQPLYFGYQTALARLPGPGRGSYFVAIAVALSLVAPVLAKMFQRHPRATLAGSFVVDIGFELLAPHVPLLADPWNYAVNPLRYLPLFVLGMALVGDNGRAADVLRKPLVWLYGVASVVFLISWNAGTVDLAFLVPGWTAQNPLGFGYAFLLCALAMRFLPADEKSGPRSLVATTGKASYHVFLVQMIVVVVSPSTTVARVLLNLALSIALGVTWWRAESRLMLRPA